MEATELQIKDWVNTPNGIGQVRTIGIFCGYVGDTCYEFDEVSPIPLTPEILEKNGFVKSTIEEDVYNFPDNNKALKERGFALNYHDYGRWFITDHNLMKILYVHQLQRALRLCGLGEIADKFKL